MPPVSLLIKPVSSSCNMNCKYCFYCDVSQHREFKSYGIMSEQTLELVVKNALEYAELECSFGFQGGEPTLIGLDFYKKLLAFQQKYNTKKVKISNIIQTNGLIINEEWADFFAANSFLVGLSLDGYKELHDSLRLDRQGKPTFNKVMRAVELFKKHNVEFNILCVVNQFTARHGKKMWVFFKEHELKYLQFIPCIDGFSGEKFEHSLTVKRYGEFLVDTFNCYYQDFFNGDYTSVRNFDNYISMILNKPPEHCGMSGVCSSYFVIESDGSVFPCDFYVLDRYKIGNVQHNSFSEMRSHENCGKFTEKSYVVDEKCKTCKWFGLCRGGCRRYRDTATYEVAEGELSLNVFCEAYISFFNSHFQNMQSIAKTLN